MDYESLLKQIDAEIELLEKARELLTAISKPKKAPKKTVGGTGSKDVRFRDFYGSAPSTRSKRSRTSFKIFEAKRGDSGSSGGGTGDGGYGIVRRTRR